MAPPTPPRDRHGFHIAIICALTVEANCVQVLFDKFWEDEGKRYGQAPGDTNSYTTGMIGEHNVVLAYMPNIGNVGASGVAASLRSSFPEIKLALVVGICGGVPFGTDKEEILLGDIIISTSLVQFDFGRQYPQVFEEKDSLGDSLGRPSQRIRGFLTKLRTHRYHSRIQNDVKWYLKELQQKLSKAKHPGAEMDKLYEASYLHKHRESPNDACGKCAEGGMQICTAARRMTCDELGCEERRLVVRNRLQKPQETQHADSSLQLQPMVHFGKIGSGNKVMKCAEDRDRIAKASDIVAFEMEGAGVWDHFPSIVIKAVCDYADSHKNKLWQDYAAATAAACMKAFLIEWTAEDNSLEQEQAFGPLWCVPFNRLQKFVGRSNEIKTLETKLSLRNGCRRVAVLGLGGVGKSRIALELAHRTKSQRPDHSVFWVQATDALTFENDMYEIGKKLKIQGIEDDKADIKNLVKQRLNHESAGPWLMILDNADDEAIWGRNSTLTDYLPDSSTGSVLVTTRTRRVAIHLASKESVELWEMEKEEALEMLRNVIAKPEILTDLDASATLLERLAYLPLAINQAAAYINMNDESIQVYLELLNDTEDNIIELLSEDFQTEGRYKDAKNPIAATWLVSFEQIQHQNALAADYMSFISCLSETNIPQSLLPVAPKKMMIDALGVIKAYFFLWKRNGSDFLDPLYDMHRLVRLATRTWLKSRNSLAKWTEIAIKRLAEVFPTYKHKYKDQWILYMPHAQMLCDSYLGQDLLERYVLLERMGYWLAMDGKYQEAVRILSSVVLWREMKLGEMSESTWVAYECLGQALRGQGDWTESEKYHKQAVEGRTVKLGGEHPDTLNSMGSLAIIYQRQGRWMEAEELGVQVMETRKRLLGREHPDTLMSMGSLASTYRLQGRWMEAEELEVQVVKTIKRVLGAEHPYTLTSMGTLASTYRRQGRWTEAEELEMQVMEATTRVLGTEHPDTLSSLGNLASIYRRQGRLTKAEELEVQVMETTKRVLGVEHPDTLTSMGSLASIYRRQGRSTEAEELEVQVVKTMKRVLGVEHPHTLTSIGSLALIYRRQGRWTEAEELEVQVMETRKRVLGREHPETLVSMGNLASLYQDQGRSTEAEELGIQVVEMMKRVLGTEHPRTLTNMHNLAWTYQRQGRWTEATELEMQVMETTKRVLGTEHPDTLSSMGNLASTYQRQGRWTEAEELEVQVMETTKKVLGAEHPDTLTSMHNLALIYRRQERWTEAEELEVQVEEMRTRVLDVEERIH